MRQHKEYPQQRGVLAVLAAAAREAEELLAIESNLDQGIIGEANRRIELFMRAARQVQR
jgi:hypothetical protein